MDSYPSEFTCHTSPLLFVAGLNSSSSPPQATQAPVNDPFEILKNALKKTFTLNSRKGFQLWDPTRGHQLSFHTMLVDKTLRFPPLKARPTSTSTSTPQPPTALHSPISPLTPSSPLYPDGIIAPIWIRKHRELVPSVFILVLRLFELPPTGGTTVDPIEREELERRQDSSLIREIVERKRTTLERGIKLAVVLICSRDLLDDSSLDLRLSLIRRQSGLDSRASLFVISPVPQSEVTNFVDSIRNELLPSAIDYYREHGRRVRRKRARQQPQVLATRGGLSEKGWNVRYDYKLGLFAEMRGEIEVALKHYEDCYETLVDMFGQREPNSLLIARTKRWAEAKVLADCLTVKIAKLYLYLNDPSHSLSQLNHHVYRFRQLSQSWSIGEETFEFWSWLSKQYRLFGDLTSTALRNGFRLPSLRPPPTPVPPNSNSTASTSGGSIPPSQAVSSIPSPGLIPINVLQHSGHYYLLAAVCAVERRERYRKIVTIERSKEEEVEGGGGSRTKTIPPDVALVHEGKVDHTEIIIELYTKAYEHFKLHSRRRTTYSIANLIASTHASSSSPSSDRTTPSSVEMALKFWDRIGKNYRTRDLPVVWNEILGGIGEDGFECAVRGEKWKEAIKAGWELIAPRSSISVDRRAQYAQELRSILTTRSPTTTEEATIFLDTDVSPLLIPRLTFLKSTTTISTPIPFQLSITSPPSARLNDFTFDTLDIHFNDDRPPLTIRHSTLADGDTPKTTVERYDVGDVSEEGEKGNQRTADLGWRDGTTKVFVGTVTVDRAMSLTIEKIVIGLSLGEWTIKAELKLDEVSEQAQWYLDDSRLIPMRHSRPSICSVMPRELCLDVKVSHAAPAYIGERFPIELEITNTDEIDVEVSFVGFLQPGEEGARGLISLDGESSSSLLDSIPLGQLEPGQSIHKTAYLQCLGTGGDRQFEITIRSSPAPSSSRVDDPAKPTSTESTHSFTILSASPFLVKFDTFLYPRRTPLAHLLDFENEPTGWEGSTQANVSAQIRPRGPWSIDFVEIKVEEQGSLVARITSSSLDEIASELPLSLTPGDVLGTIFGLEIKPTTPDLSPLSNYPVLSITWRRTNTTETTTTLVPLPPLEPSPLTPRVTLRLPPVLTTHVPSTLIYTLSNPTTRMITLATQIDSTSSSPGSFVFSGPRKLNRIVLVPDEERTMEIELTPLVVGKVAIPRFRVFEIEPPQQQQQGEREGAVVPLPPPRMRELAVEVETQRIENVEEGRGESVGSVETELRRARAEGERGGMVEGNEVRVLVLPQ